ncbi:unnamed protein product [Cochlearia groenlandica]
MSERPAIDDREGQEKMSFVFIEAASGRRLGHVLRLHRYLDGVMFPMYRLPFVECLMFGLLISATDPVTVLSIFQELAFGFLVMLMLFNDS